MASGTTAFASSSSMCFAHDFANAVEPGESLRDLSSDLRNLDYRTCRDPGKQENMASCPSLISPARIARLPITIMMIPAMPNRTVDSGAGRRDGGDRPLDIASSLSTPSENTAVLPRFCSVGLDHPDPSERLGEPSCHLCRQAPRSRKIGRTFLNTNDIIAPNAPRVTIMMSVIFQCR